MPFVPGDRLRTGAGRVEIFFADGSGIEVGEDSEVESISPTRVASSASVKSETSSSITRSIAPRSNADRVW